MTSSRIAFVCAVLSVALVGIAQQSQPSKPQMPPAKPAPSKPNAAPASVLPDDGSINGNVYTSDYFRFSYKFPGNLEVNENFMEAHEDASKRAFVLLAIEADAERPGFRQLLVLTADRNSSPPVKNAAEYLDKTTRERFEPRGFQVVNAAREVKFGGRSFARIDYRKGDIQQTLVATLRRGYVLTFIMSAPSAEEIETMVRSLESLKFAQLTPPPAR